MATLQIQFQNKKSSKKNNSITLQPLISGSPNLESIDCRVLNETVGTI